MPTPSSPAAVAILYRWRLHPGREQEFEHAWATVTRHLHAHHGSFGSRLHRGDDGLWYAYAAWPSLEHRAAAFEADALVVPVRAADEDRDEAPRAKKARVAVSCASFHDDEFARASRDALDLGGGATLLALDPGQFAAAVARVGALAEET